MRCPGCGDLDCPRMSFECDRETLRDDREGEMTDASWALSTPRLWESPDARSIPTLLAAIGQALARSTARDDREGETVTAEQAWDEAAEAWAEWSASYMQGDNGPPDPPRNPYADMARAVAADREGETLRSALIDLLDDSRPGPFTPAGTTQPVIYVSDLRAVLASRAVALLRDDREATELAAYRKAHVCTVDCRKNKHVAFVGRKALDAVIAASVAARDDREGETVTEAERLALYIEEQARRFIEAGKAMGLPFDMPVRAKHAGYMEAASMVRNAPADWSPVTPDGGDQS